MKRVEKVLAGFEDNADVVRGCLKDLLLSAWGKRDGRWGCGRPSTSPRQVLKAAANARMHCPRNQDLLNKFMTRQLNEFIFREPLDYFIK